MKAIFKVFQSMMFRREGEFDISAAGVQSSAQSLPMPYPSTLIGALASIKFNKAPSSKSWIEEVKEVIGKEINVKGPYLRFKDKLFVYNEIFDLFIPIYKVREYCNLIKEILKEKDPYLRSELDEKIKELGKEEIFKEDERIGIKLEARSKGIKVAEEHAIYSARFVAYREVSAEIILDILKGEINKGNYHIKLGGENKAANLLVEDGSVFEEIKNSKIIENRANTILVLSPVLFATPLEDIKDKIEKEIGIKVENIYGSVKLLGSGYSLSKEKRKPIYASLLSGSVIVLKDLVNSEKVYQEGIGVAKELGYGTLLPISL